MSESLNCSLKRFIQNSNESANAAWFSKKRKGSVVTLSQIILFGRAKTDKQAAVLWQNVSCSISSLSNCCIQEWYFCGYRALAPVILLNIVKSWQVVYTQRDDCFTVVFYNLHFIAYVTDLSANISLLYSRLNICFQSAGYSNRYYYAIFRLVSRKKSCTHTHTHTHTH